MEKMRLDVAMVKQGLVNSREKAKALIMAGQVMVDGKRVDKAGTSVELSSKIKIYGPILPYVSRGGLKLEKALNFFPINLMNKVVADIGASTGGFTDCALQNGAQKVYAIDVGYGQLDWKLRTDSRVINMERTNARYLTPSDLGEQVDFVTIDVAFISLDKILPVIKTILKKDGEVVALIKPQFEAGKEKVGKKGVVKDPDVHWEVIKKVLDLSKGLGFGIKGLTYSPVKGPEGNVEYLLWLDNSGQSREIDVKLVINEANQKLNDKG
ncbi:MAG: rRNA (cytidine1920-2-O)/16S rRNA (cytidine1409-2-O)-methyltransferase [Clostridia bacterium]|jgi:23S rRNA (cytidine1920-2'-O)/16S rRNA (cytidine1409-2'-O)-methyltransferase|nr:rRNA (cytidine1920-2-O)/16S rRNA (cytidine1409-2-O)-methyltransferase [Clostridia bacterium]MDN5323065.1 rRNA (cytidine1920-2-O)/16S rRNA (cytidine1409-2-O)-methyltransferase [Clostridia bacterium]